MREWSEEEGIDVGKLPASTSLIYQALDRAATFKIGKKKLKKVTASGMWVGDVIVELKMQEAFDELAGGGSNPLVAGAKWHAAATTSEQRKRFIYAILRIKFVLPSAIGPQVIVMTRLIVTRISVAMCGLYYIVQHTSIPLHVNCY